VDGIDAEAEIDALAARIADDAQAILFVLVDQFCSMRSGRIATQTRVNRRKDFFRITPQNCKSKRKEHDGTPVEISQMWSAHSQQISDWPRFLGL